jgi:hypothetical protein
MQCLYVKSSFMPALEEEVGALAEVSSIQLPQRYAAHHTSAGGMLRIGQGVLRNSVLQVYTLLAPEHLVITCDL